MSSSSFSSSSSSSPPSTKTSTPMTVASTTSPSINDRLRLKMTMMIMLSSFLIITAVIAAASTFSSSRPVVVAVAAAEQNQQRQPFPKSFIPSFLSSSQRYAPPNELSPGVTRDFLAMVERMELQRQQQQKEQTITSGGDNSNNRRLLVEEEQQQEQQDRELQEQDDTIDLDLPFCYDALFIADENKDFQVDREEYVTFVQIMSPIGTLPDLENGFTDLPLILQSNFIILACLCLSFPDPDPQCCAVNPHINNNGTWPGQIPTPEQEQYLYQVCFLTETSIDRLVVSLTPTTSPTDEGGDRPTFPPQPLPTEPPQPLPTEAPTLVTDVPSTVPSSLPTMKPTTISPTTMVPTTSMPSDIPSDVPSDVVVVTDVPTMVVEETDSPTLQSPAPTVSPTIVVTVEPTTMSPTITATSNPTLVGGGVEQIANVTYSIAIRDGLEDVNNPFTDTSSEYIPDLIAAMDLLAVQVAVAWNANQTTSPGKRSLLTKQYPDSRQRRRRLQTTTTTTPMVEVILPTSVEDETRIDCPMSMSSVDPSTDACVDIDASINLIVTLMDDDNDGEEEINNDPAADLTETLEGGTDTAAATVANDVEAVTASFENALNVAIENGGLQAALNTVNPNSPVVVTTGSTGPEPSPPTPTEVAPPIQSPTTAPTNDDGGSGGNLSAGAIAGIAVAGAALMAGAALFAFRHPARRQSDNKKGGGNDDEEQLKALEEADYDREFQQQYGSASSSGGGVATAAAAAAPPYGSGAGGIGYGGGVGGSKTGGGGAPAGLMVAGGVVAGTAAAAALASSGKSTSTSGGSPNKKKRSGSSGPLYSVPGAKGISDEGSSAGDSGWSSNQDMSSVDSKSVDRSMDSTQGLQPPSTGNNTAAAAGGAVLVGAAAVGAVSAAAATRSQSSSVYSSSRDESSHGDADTGTLSIQSTYSELDQAISKGDWAAVGVTAALLASQAYSTDDDSSKGTGTNSKPRIGTQTTLNPQRAAELDALVEAGDWEGVVAAAAKFDAQEALRGDSSLGGTMTAGSASVHSQSNDSPSGGSVGGSSTGTGPSFLSASGTLESTTTPSTFTAAGFTATSDTASTRSKARKLNEIRDEVEALVNAVVPEEADNVDEMMTQFRGREEELVETLRSMQERQVAQKARIESQKQAKRDAKANVESQRKQGNKVGAVDNTGSPADDQWMEELEGGGPSSSTGGGAAGLTPHKEEHEEEMKAQLKEAIEKEDWQNVADAASGLSGHLPPTPTRGTMMQQDDMTTASDRSREINDLVDKGDWDAVVAAASRYVEADTTNVVMPGVGVGGIGTSAAATSTTEERRRRRQERLKEEQEALEQADIWNAIAEQTKSGDQTDTDEKNLAGANLAAAWAIDRSLNALNRAEQQQDIGTSQSSEDDDDEANQREV